MTSASFTRQQRQARPRPWWWAWLHPGARRTDLRPATAAPQHPLPWRNTPTDGRNHVVDARGLVVYEGCDASEMFRLLATSQSRPGTRS